MNFPETLRARLTFWYIAALTLTLTAFAILLYVWLGRTLYRHHDSELLADADRIASALDRVPLDERSVGRELSHLGGIPPLLMVRNHHGELIYRSPVLQVAEPSIGEHEALIHAAVTGPRDPEFFTVSLERSGPVRFICTPIVGSPAAYVQIGSPLGDIPATMHAVAIASVVLVPAVVLLTSFGGWLLAGRALEPIHTIDATLRDIEATNLARRVETRPSDRELKGMVGTINGLLARLERAFQDLREFTADASHQLQTPLTVMKNTIELARRDRSKDRTETLRVLDEVEEELDEVSGVIAALQSLSLAEADAAASMSPVNFSDVCREASEIIAALGEAHDVHVDITVDPDIHVVGDSVRLKQLPLNLGDNAIKYTPAGGRVTIRLKGDLTTATLSVSDTGSGIAPDQLPRIFDRFYRAPDAPRARGAGLGLAIVKRIVESHRGNIVVESQLEGGSCFTVTLPRA